tara:strand:+ start:288 stop:449 length:162 start_codon:yes stop_codon:yes gene_type:complete
MGNKLLAVALTILFTIIVLIIGCYYGMLAVLISLLGLLLFAIVYNTILLFIED